MKTMLVFLSVFLIVATAVFAVDCTETDQGRSTGVFGTCTDSLGVHNDECLGGFLKEWACDGNSCVRTYEACASGCSAGACIGDQPSAAAKCSEDDKGQDVYTASSCYDPSSHPDYCIGGDGKTQIREWYCKNDACAYTESTCPIGYVCKGTPGACVRSGVLPSKCTETDGGKNFEVAGACTDKNGNKTDACYRGKYVQEFFCKSDLCRTEYKLCKYGCVDGRCLSQATTITTSTTTTIFPNKCTYAGERKCLGLGLMECQSVSGGYLDWVRIEQLSQQCCTGESCCKETDGGINDLYTPGSVTGFSYEKKYAQWNDKCEYLKGEAISVLEVDTLQFPNGTVKLELVGANSDSNTATIKVNGISRTVKEGSEIKVMGSYIYINSIFTYNIPAPGAALEYFYPGKGENRLVEYGCEKDYARLAIESCDYGCSEGACKKARNDDLVYYPKMYSDSGVFVVVSKNANSFDTVLAINISKSLQKAGIKVSAVKLDSEVIDPLNENLISVDGACVNSVSASLMGNPANCADGLEEGKGIIKLFNNNGKAQIMVAGWEQSDLKLAGAVLVNYMRYNLSGKEYIVTATYPCIPAGSKGSYSKNDACCEGLNRISNSLVINGSQCAYPRTPDDTFVCANCPDGKCGLGENKCNCDQDCRNCAAEGQEYSKVWTSEYPSNCCAGLTEWARGFDTRKVVDGVCVPTGAVSGYPVGLCINCGNGVCEKDENVCNCEKDCIKKCTDSDKGKNIYMKGTASGLRQGAKVNKTDYCFYGQINEYYCGAAYQEQLDEVYITSQKCPFGCLDGACVRGFNEDLKYYPQMMQVQGSWIVVGDNAVASDVVVSVDIALSLQKAGVPTAALLASEIANPLKDNLISVGGPCSNSVSAMLLGNPANCAAGFQENTGYIKLFNVNGMAQIMVAGWSPIDTRRAGIVLADKHGAFKSIIYGRELVVTGTSLSDITVSQPI